MDKIQKIIQWLYQLPIPGKIISVIVIALVSVLVIFFGTGCAYRISSGNDVNVEHRISLDSHINTKVK